MSENRVLVLMAGGYSAEAVQKHLLSVEGLPLFERVINAVPAKNVWVVFNKSTYTFWSTWQATVAPVTFPDKRFSFFVEGNKQGAVNNPSLWMTTGVPSLTMNLEIKEVVFSAIDSYFDNFNFMDEFMEYDHAIVVTKGQGSTLVDLNWRGKLNTMFRAEPVGEGDWGFADMFKTTTNVLLVNGQLPKGNMASVVVSMMEKGTVFKVVKASGPFMDCGTQERLDKAEHLYSVTTKGSVVA